jgi:hypothetical protein
MCIFPEVGWLLLVVVALLGVPIPSLGIYASTPLEPTLWASLLGRVVLLRPLPPISTFDTSFAIIRTPLTPLLRSRVEHVRVITLVALLAAPRFRKELTNPIGLHLLFI